MIQRLTFLTATLFLALAGMINASAYAKPIDTGSRRELFVDKYLIQRMEGVRIKLHRLSELHHGVAQR